MHRLSLTFVLALVAGCVSERAPDTSSRRDGLPGVPLGPQFVGRTSNARLGTSVAACRGPAFVAGAPGENATYLSLDGGQYLPIPMAFGDGGAVGIAVACEGAGINLRVMTAGWSGVWVLNTDGGSMRLRSGDVEALERSPTAATPMIVGLPNEGRVELDMPQGFGFLNVSTLNAPSRFGAALAWDPSGTLFVVGDPTSATVFLFSWGDGGTNGPLSTLAGPGGSGFGAALAIGDVHPNPGLELIIGAPQGDQVFVYGLRGQREQLMVLDLLGQQTGSFGTSLAIEPTPVSGGTLRALWVGDPFNEQVVRFVGDAGEVLTPVTPLFPQAYFGFSLAVAEQTLVVGAPLFSELEARAGAVYTFPFGTTPIASSVPMACDLFAPCFSTTCEVGTCIGGVVCHLSGPACPPMSCSNNGVCFDAGVATDAGRPDAGGPDAGVVRDGGSTEPDAGRGDAGMGDAGAVDAGARLSDGGVLEADAGIAVERYGTCGCSGAAALPLVLLSLVFSRSARKRRSGHSALPL